MKGKECPLLFDKTQLYTNSTSIITHGKESCNVNGGSVFVSDSFFDDNSVDSRYL